MPIVQSRNTLQTLFSSAQMFLIKLFWAYFGNTQRFNKTTALGFNQWLKKQVIDFLNQEPERKILKKSHWSEIEKLRIRILSVLDSQFNGKLENDIIGQVINVLTPVLKMSLQITLSVQSPDTMHTLNSSMMIASIVFLIFLRFKKSILFDSSDSYSHFTIILVS